jgi:hypothetical protein
VRNFIICTHHQISLTGQVKANEVQGMWHAWERRENCTRFWWESAKERDHSEDHGVGGKNGIRMGLREIGLGCVDWIRLARQGSMAGCCECGDEPSGSCATELVSNLKSGNRNYG